MVRGDFAGDVESIAAGLADGVERCPGGDVGDVEVGAGVFDLSQQADVSLDQTGLGFYGHSAQAQPEGYRPGVHGAASGEARVFGVLDDGQVGAGGGEEGFAHDAVAEDGLAVVGDGYGSGGAERSVFGQDFAHRSASGGSDGEDADWRRCARGRASSG